MTSFQHQIVIEVVSSTEMHQGSQVQGQNNRVQLHSKIMELIEGCSELRDESHGLIEARIIDGSTVEMNPAIRRRRGQFLNFILPKTDVRDRWNNRLRHFSVGANSFIEGERAENIELVRNSRHLIVSSREGMYSGYVFTLPEIQENNEALWNKVRDAIEVEISKIIDSTIKQTVMSELEGSFEDGLIERIREATIDKHISEALLNETTTV